MENLGNDFFKESNLQKLFSNPFKSNSAVLEYKTENKKKNTDKRRYEENSLAAAIDEKKQGGRGARISPIENG